MLPETRHGKPNLLERRGREVRVRLVSKNPWVRESYKNTKACIDRDRGKPLKFSAWGRLRRVYQRYSTPAVKPWTQ